MASESNFGELPSIEEERQKYETEIDVLIRLFDEGDYKVPSASRQSSDGGGMGKVAQRRKAAAFLEGSRLPYSALCKAIFEDLRQVVGPTDNDTSAVTLAGVQNLVLTSGQRESFGVTGSDLVILEDDNPRCLWRWEARDLRLVPKASRDRVLDRRCWCKKVGERVKALFAAVQALVGAETADSEGRGQVLLNARELLAKTDSEVVLRAGMEPKPRESGIPGDFVGENSELQRDVPLVDVSNEISPVSILKKKRLTPEEQDKLEQVKVEKRLKAQSEKEQKELRKEQKQQKRQQLDEVERRKQLALTKQASLMSKIFGKRSTVSGGGQGQQSEPIDASVAPEVENVDSSLPDVSQARESTSVAAQIEFELQRRDELDFEALRRCHVDRWVSLRVRDFSRARNWNVRRKPKVSVHRELRLQGTASDQKGGGQDAYRDDNESRRWSDGASPLKQGRGDESCEMESKDSTDISVTSSQDEVKKCNSGKFQILRNRAKKLLQFDKSHRPPYYGTHSKRSKHIKPRRPLGHDPDLNYEVDSDEEWEEDEPGESLSDAEMEDDEEKRELDAMEEDEDGDDEFFVPDGYLSEGEGVIDDSEREGFQKPPSGALLSPATPAQENSMSMERLRKILDNATENAIRANHPLIISNFGSPDKNDSFESPTPLSKRSDILCLEALRMRVLVPGMIVSVA